MEPIRVLVVDDHTLFREGLCMLLAAEDGIQVIGGAADGLQALSMAGTLQPDIMLLDIKMPDVNGLQVLHKLRTTSPRTKALILTGFLDYELIAGALGGGAKGYVMKTAQPPELVKAIRSVQAGEIWAERKVLAVFLEGLLQKVSNLNRPLSEMREALTDREHEVVQWVIQGMTNKQIAARLGISEKTVKTHLSNVFRKLNVSGRIELLLYRLVERAD